MPNSALQAVLTLSLLRHLPLIIPMALPIA